MKTGQILVLVGVVLLIIFLINYNKIFGKKFGLGGGVSRTPTPPNVNSPTIQCSCNGKIYSGNGCPCVEKSNSDN